MTTDLYTELPASSPRPSITPSGAPDVLPADAGEHQRHVVVVGCGRVGSSLARILAGAGHSVAVIDKRAEAFGRFLDDWDGHKVVGPGFDRDCLERAGIERATALAAVTSGDNSNIIVARIARETYGIENVVARIYDGRRARVYERLGIPTIATVDWTVHEALRGLVPQASPAAWTHASNELSVTELPVAATWVGRTVGEAEEPPAIRALALTRTKETTVPDASVVLQEGDRLVVALTGDGRARLIEKGWL